MFVLHLFDHGIGPIQPQFNLQAYPFIVGGLIAATMLSLIALVRDWRASEGNSRQTLFVTLFVLYVLQLVVLELIWLGISTPLERLPLWQPPPNDALWLGFVPGAAVYATLAVIIHGLVAYFGSTALIGYWLGILSPLLRWNFPLMVRFQAFLAFLVVALNPLMWEVQHWPLAFIVGGEMGLLSYGCLIFANSIAGPLDIRILRDNIRGFRVQMAFSVFLMFLAGAYIWLAHQVDFAYANLFGLFFVLALIDDFVAAILGAFNDQRDYFYIYLSPWRWPLSLLLIAIITLLGALGVFGGISHNHGLTYTVWIIAGATAMTYALFRALTDLVRAPVYQHVSRLLEARVVQQFRRTYHFDEDVVEELFGGRFASGVAQASPSEQDTVGPGQRIVEAMPVAAGEPSRRVAQGGNDSVRFFQSLNFRAFAIFLGAIILYYWFITTVTLPTVLFGKLNPLQIVGYVGPTVLGLLSFLRGIKLGPRISTLSQVLLYFTLLVIGATVAIDFFAGDIVGQDFTGTPPGNLLTNQIFWLATASLFLQTLSIMLIIGHFFYLGQMLLTKLRFNPEEREGSHVAVLTERSSYSE